METKEIKEIKKLLDKAQSLAPNETIRITLKWTKKRINKLYPKSILYKDSWKGYSMNTLTMLADHRCQEVRATFRDTGNIDRDQVFDYQNFGDFQLEKDEMMKIET